MEPEFVPHRALSLNLSLMGRPVKSYTFEKPVITVGRDPEADVYIDNPGVSREHLRIERAGSGLYEVVDLGTANGSLLNDEPLLGRVPVCDGDRMGVGKFTLTVQYDFGHPQPAASQPAFGDQATTVLSKEDLAKVLQLHRRTDAVPPRPLPAAGFPAPTVVPAPERAAPQSGGKLTMGTVVVCAVAAFALGVATGAFLVMMKPF